MNITGGVKHPDNLTRKEKLQRIAAFTCHKEAQKFWMQNARGISKAAFNEARA